MQSNGEPQATTEEQRNTLLWTREGLFCMKSPLEETESSKYNNFSLAELWQSLIG